MAIKVIGLDIAKSVFQVHGVDEAGQVVLRRRLRRAEVLKLFARHRAGARWHRGLPHCALLGSRDRGART